VVDEQIVRLKVS